MGASVGGSGGVNAGVGASLGGGRGVNASVGQMITLASGAHLTLNADGTFTYDQNHAFDSTPAASSGARADVSMTRSAPPSS